MTRRTGRTRAAVVIGVAAALAILGVVSFARVLGADQPLIGVEWLQSSAGPVVVGVDPASPASRAGLQFGDILRTADGRRVRSALEAAELPWEIGVGGTVTLEVLRAGEPITVKITARGARRFESYGYLSLVGFAFLVSAVFIALRWPTVRGGTQYALLAGALFVRLVYTAIGTGDRLDWVIYWADVFAGACVPPLLILLALALSRRRPGRAVRATMAVAWMAVIAAILWVHPAVLGGAYRFFDPVQAVQSIDRGLMLLFAIAMAVSARVMGRAHAHSRSALHRGQLRWTQWGLFLGFAPFLGLHGLPWALGATSMPAWVEFVAVLPMLVVPAAFTAALARYRLNDLDVFLRRAATEVSAVFLVFAVYASVVFLLRQGLLDALDLSGKAVRYVGMLVAAVSYPQLRRWVRDGIDRAFYRKRYSYRATLLEWARDLGAELELEPLLNTLRDRVRQTLGVSHATAFVLTGDGVFEDPTAGPAESRLELRPEWIERLEESSHVAFDPGELAGIRWRGHLFGMKVKGSLRAILAVSERDDPEEPLTSEDRSLLTTFSAHAATAIEAARLVREVRLRADEVSRLHARERTILESSAVGLLMLDVDGVIVAWNRALEEIYALPREQAIGMTLREVFPLHFVREIERHFRGMPGSEDGRVFRHTLVDRAGLRRVLNLSITPADRSHGTSGARVVTFDDVSERVKLEEQLLRQERLVSLGLLAAGVAHEVNTPLTGISSYTQMLLEELEPGDPRRPVLEKIEGQTRRASNIANSLLNMAQPDRSGLESLSLNAVVRESLQLFEPQVRGGAVRLETSLAPNLPAVRGHRGKLQQVVLNLLINARDAVGHEGRIAIATRDVDGRIVVEVEDDGSGIAEEDLPRIFDPFFTTKSRGRGTGLGLSITYGIIREHDGEIHVESDPGAFTRFRIELPADSVARALA